MHEESWRNEGVIEQIKQYADGKIWKIDADKYPRWIEKYKVDSLPTIIIVDAKTMKPISKSVGFINAEQLERFLRYPKSVSFDTPIRSELNKKQP